MKITQSIATILTLLLPILLLAQSSDALQNSASCPLMVLKVNPVPNSSEFRVSYCNLGNDQAVDAYLLFEIADFKPLKQTSIPFQLMPNGAYKFELGTLNPDQCEEFSVQFHASHKNFCFNAKIFPDVPCQSMIDHYLETYVNSSSGVSNNDTSSTSNYNSNHVAGRQQLPTGIPGLDASSVFEDNVILINVPDSLFINGSTSSSMTSSNTHAANSTRTFDMGSIVTIDYCSDASNTTTPTASTHPNHSNNTTDTRPVLNSTNSTEIIDDSPSNRHLKTYPNPFETFTTIELHKPSDRLQIVLRNLNGQIIRSRSVSQQSTIRIDRKDLAQGMYLVQLIDAAQIIHTEKLIVR
jgi:hypothetical protein